MSAPNAVDESAMRSDSWAPQDGQPVGPGGNPQATNGQSLPVDDRGAVQSPENPDFPRGSSVTDNETFREKQVKVLRSFLSVFCLLVRSSSWVWHSMLGCLSSRASPHSSPLLLFFGGYSTLCSEYFF